MSLTRLPIDRETITSVKRATLKQLKKNTGGGLLLQCELLFLILFAPRSGLLKGNSKEVALHHRMQLFSHIMRSKEACGRSIH